MINPDHRNHDLFVKHQEIETSDPALGTAVALYACSQLLPNLNACVQSNRNQDFLGRSVTADPKRAGFGDEIVP